MEFQIGEVKTAMIRRIGSAQDFLNQLRDKRADLHEKKMTLLSCINADNSLETLLTLKGKLTTSIRTDILAILRKNLDDSFELQDMYKRASFLTILAQLYMEVVGISGYISLDTGEAFYGNLVAASKNLLSDLNG